MTLGLGSLVGLSPHWSRKQLSSKFSDYAIALSITSVEDFNLLVCSSNNFLPGWMVSAIAMAEAALAPDLVVSHF
ncbi:hypothetical protein HAX54_033955 [Datura stramonium]|uniref:Uncharacterized protein n=1 Tax=Datura stramonium TaxID=4076 RepID=A0ABS8SDV9_DATST|nr:hypothetical protein [Datura stramonium]